MTGWRRGQYAGLQRDARVRLANVTRSLSAVSGRLPHLITLTRDPGCMSKARC